jgi:hypothetical protein
MRIIERMWQEDPVEAERWVHNGEGKCQHGVYGTMLDHGCISPYCSLCCPDGPPFETRDLKMPRKLIMRVAEHRANVHRSEACSRCGSLVYVDLGEMRICADCDNSYPAPIPRKHA